MWTHRRGQTCFHFSPHLRHKGRIEKTSLTPRPLTRRDREVAFVHSSAPPCIVTDVTGVAKLITGIRSDLNIFLAGSFYIGEHRAKRIRRCWRKLHHGSPTISVWGCPMGSAARLAAERSTCGTATGPYLFFFFP